MQAEILSFTALVIALLSAVISYVLLRAQSEPEVVVYAVADLGRPSIINLIIENIGKGIARNVSFRTSRPMPQEAFGFENAAIPKQMQRGPIVHGIAFLHPGERRVITWGQYGGLTKGLEDQPLDVTATYYSSPAFKLVRKKHVTSSTIDIKSFEGTDASDGNWDKKSAEQLQKIAETLRRVTDLSTQSIKIVVKRQK
jgi:hypothetical protein